MRYLALVMRLAMFVFGLYMVCMFPEMHKPPFISGLTFMLIALYLQFFVKNSHLDCNECKKKEKKHKKDKKEKKHKKDKKSKKDKYEGNY